MGTKLLSQMKDTDSRAEPLGPEQPVYLVIEQTRVNVVLSQHNSHGILIAESTHKNVSAAKQAAEKERGSLFNDWGTFPPNISSVARLVQANAGHRLASGQDKALAYVRPQAEKAKWWQLTDFPAELASSIALIFTFCLICLTYSVHGDVLPLPIGLILVVFFFAKVSAGLVYFMYLGILGTIFSVVFWNSTTTNVILGMAGVLILAFIAATILYIAATHIVSAWEFLLTSATTIPFAICAWRRASRLTRRWSDDW